MLKLTADISLTAAARGKPRRIQIVAYTGGLMRPEGWPELVVDLAGLQTPETITLLVDHNNTIDSVAGSGRVLNDGRTLRVEGQLAETPVADQLSALAKSGVPLKASVGLSPTKTEKFDKPASVEINGQTVRIPAKGQIVRAGRLAEVSLVPIAADSETSVQIAAAARRKSDMPDTEPTTTTNVADEIQQRRELLAAEAERIAQIEELTERHPSIRAEAIRAGWDVNQTKLATLRAGYSKGPAIITSRSENNLVTRDVLSAAIIARANGEGFATKVFKDDDRILSAARRFRNLSLLDIAREINRHNGTYVDETSPDEILRAAWSPSLRASSGFSTIGLANLLSDSSNKTLRGFYAEVPASWRSMARVVSARDFKNNHVIGVSALGRLFEMGPSAEIKHSTMEEEEYQFKLSTYSAMLAITRQSIINDDLQAFSEIPRHLAIMASRTLSDSFWQVVLGNAGPHFSTGNNNQLAAGASSALSVDSLTQAIILLRKQVDLSDGAIDLNPSALVVPPELEMTARAILNSNELDRISTQDRLPVGNALRGVAALVVEPRISTSGFPSSSSTKWYLVSEPSNGAFLMAFLDGRDAPTIESTDSDFNTLGVQTRCYHDWASALGDKRSAIMSPGA